METAAAVVPALENSGLIMVYMSDQKLNGAKRWLKNRRSQRIELNAPVVVYRAAGEGRSSTKARTHLSSAPMVR